MGDSVIWVSRVFFSSYNLIYFSVSTVLSVSDTIRFQYPPGSYEVKLACTFHFFNSFHLPRLLTKFLVF